MIRTQSACPYGLIFSEFYFITFNSRKFSLRSWMGSPPSFPSNKIFQWIVISISGRPPMMGGMRGGMMRGGPPPVMRGKLTLSLCKSFEMLRIRFIYIFFSCIVLKIFFFKFPVEKYFPDHNWPKIELVYSMTNLRQSLKSVCLELSLGGF